MAREFRNLGEPEDGCVRPTREDRSLLYHKTILNPGFPVRISPTFLSQRHIPAASPASVAVNLQPF